MIPEPLFCGGLLQDTLCFIDGQTDLGDLSIHLDHWLLTRLGMRGAATIYSVCAIDNWLPCPSSSESLNRVMEGIGNKGTEIGA